MIDWSETLAYRVCYDYVGIACGNTIMALDDRENPFALMLSDLRSRILDRTLLITAIGVSAAVMLGNFTTGVPLTETMALWFLVILGCAGCYGLKSRSTQVAGYATLAIGLVLIVCSAVILNQLTFLYLLPVLIVVARFISGTSETLLVSIVASVFIIAIHLYVPGNPTTPSSLLILWATFFLTQMMLESVMDELKTVNQYQRYTVNQMQEARSNRAVLAQRTKMLDEATQNLQYANSQLREARRTAETARQLKAQFAANVSHELRTPINLITGFSEMIVSSPASYAVRLPTPYWSDLNTIYRNARHLQSLINDILDVSQIEAGQMAIVKEEIHPATILNEAADMLREQIHYKGLEFNLNIAPDLPVLWLDRVRIRQVLINLLGNALRFTDAGFIALSASFQDQHVLITVEDTGAGIPQVELERVFEEFHQVDNSLARQHTGSGLGLTLSKRFVEMHGGKIWVESAGETGKGSQFYIELPVEDPTLSQPMIIGQPAHDSQKTRHFIVMDEDVVVLQLFKRYVTKHKVISTTDITQVTSMVDTVKPSAIVMDSKYAQELDPVIRDELSEIAPLITCPMPSGRRIMQNLGVRDYLVKPVTQSVLQGAIAQLAQPIKSVLIVDDDQEIVRLFSRMIQAMSDQYEVRKAYSGLEGIALMQTQPPDLVLLDLLMPDIDGLTLLERMKALPELAPIPVIMISARGASESVASPLQGMLTIKKQAGFQPIELVRCIDDIVENLT